MNEILEAASSQSTQCKTGFRNEMIVLWAVDATLQLHIMKYRQCEERK